MDDYRRILRRVGLSMIVLGLTDIAVMVYCIRKGYGYLSSFNILAVVGGIFVWRGSPQAIRVVTFFSAFFLVSFAAMMLVFPLLQPLELTKLQFQQQTMWLTTALVLLPALLLGLWWVNRQLRSGPVLQMLQSAGSPERRPWLPFALVDCWWLPLPRLSWRPRGPHPDTRR